MRIASRQLQKGAQAAKECARVLAHLSTWEKVQQGKDWAIKLMSPMILEIDHWPLWHGRGIHNRFNDLKAHLLQKW